MARALLLLSVLAVCVSGALAQYRIGIIRPSKIQLVTDDVNEDDITLYALEAANWKEASPAASQTQDWLNKWDSARTKICFTRYNNNAWDHVGGQYETGSWGLDAATDNGHDLGTVDISVSYRGANTQTVSWADQEAGEKCAIFSVSGSGATECTFTDDCAAGGGAESCNVYTAGTGQLFEWECKGDSLPSATDGEAEDTQGWCNSNVLQSFVSVDMTITPIDWTDKVYMKNPDTLYDEGEAGLERNYRQQLESAATYIIDIMRDCPASGTLDGAETTTYTDGATFFANTPVMTYYLKWSESSLIGANEIRMDCTYNTCSCGTDANPAACDLKMELMPLTLPEGNNWKTTPDLASTDPVAYISSVGWPIEFKGWECGVNYRKRVRITAYQGTEESTHSHYGQISLEQKTTDPGVACQPSIASSALVTQNFHVLEDDHDRNRPAQQTSATGDFTTQHTAITADHAAGTYSLLLGGRMPTEYQYDNGNFQVFLTEVGMGARWQMDADNGQGYDWSALADEGTDAAHKKVCTNVPDDYWTVGSYAQSGIYDTVDEYHQQLFNTYDFPSRQLLDLVVAQSDDGVGDGIEEYYQADTGSNPDAETSASYRLMPIRLRSGNVVKDAYITRDGSSGDDTAKFYALWQFEGTLDEFMKCVPANEVDNSSPVAPGSRGSVVSVSNNGNEELDDPNIKYEFLVHHQHITYRGERTGGAANNYTWALAGDDMVHSLAYSITINADSGAMVSANAAALDVSAEVRWAAYEACTWAQCESDATHADINLPSAHNCNDADTDTANKRLRILLKVLVAEAESPEIRDLGITNAQSKFTAGAAATSYKNVADLSGDYELVDVTYGRLDVSDPGEEQVTIGGTVYNVFYATYQTGCFSTYNSGDSAFVTDTFVSATEAATTFDVDFTLQRVKTGVNGGQWADAYSNALDTGATADDSVLSVLVDVTFDHAPVSSLAAQAFSHDFAVDLGITNNAREGEGCTSGAQCSVYTTDEMQNLPVTGKVTFVTRAASSVVVPASVTGHMREFKICELNLSPYSDCVGETAAVGTQHSCTGGSNGFTAGDYDDAPDVGGTAQSFGLLGNWVLGNKCNKALWTAWLMTTTKPGALSGGASWTYAQAAGVDDIDDNAGKKLNPIKGEWTYAYNYESHNVYDADNSIVAGSSVLCRADDDDAASEREAKTVSRFSNHGGWACEADTQCTYEVADYKLTGSGDNKNLFDAITIDMSVLPIGAELRAEVVMAIHDCTNGGARLLRGSPDPSPAAARILAARNAAPTKGAAEARRHLAQYLDRELSPVTLSALSLGVNSSMVGFYIDTVTYDDGTATESFATTGIPAYAVALIVGGSVMLVCFIFFCMYRRRYVGHPQKHGRGASGRQVYDRVVTDDPHTSTEDEALANLG